MLYPEVLDDVGPIAWVRLNRVNIMGIFFEEKKKGGENSHRWRLTCAEPESKRWTKINLPTLLLVGPSFSKTKQCNISDKSLFSTCNWFPLYCIYSNKRPT